MAVVGQHVDRGVLTCACDRRIVGRIRWEHGVHRAGRCVRSSPVVLLVSPEERGKPVQRLSTAIGARVPDVVVGHLVFHDVWRKVRLVRRREVVIEQADLRTVVGHHVAPIARVAEVDDRVVDEQILDRRVRAIIGDVVVDKRVPAGRIVSGKRHDDQRGVRPNLAAVGEVESDRLTDPPIGQVDRLKRGIVDLHELAPPVSCVGLGRVVHDLADEQRSHARLAVRVAQRGGAHGVEVDVGLAVRLRTPVRLAVPCPAEIDVIDEPHRQTVLVVPHQPQIVAMRAAEPEMVVRITGVGVRAVPLRVEVVLRKHHVAVRRNARTVGDAELLVHFDPDPIIHDAVLVFVDGRRVGIGEVPAADLHRAGGRVSQFDRVALGPIGVGEHFVDH